LNAAKAIMNLPSWLQAVMADPAGKAIVAIVAVYAIAMTAALGSRWFPKASPWVWRVVVSALVFLAGLLFFQTFDAAVLARGRVSDLAACRGASVRVGG
jgi:hypothetical protein